MRRRELINLVGAAALAPHVLPANAAERPMPALGSPMRLVDVPLFDGSIFRAREADGQILVVYWWASWCPFCALQTPHIQQLWDANRSRGLKVLGLSIDQRIEPALKYVSDRRYTFPTGHVTPGMDKALAKPGKGLPVTCVRGRDGRVLMSESGQMFPEDIEQIARFL